MRLRRFSSVTSVIGIVVAATVIFSASPKNEKAAGGTVVSASIGDPCPGPGYACTPDMKNALACAAGGRFVLAETCKGPGGCKIGISGTTADIFCDNDVSDVGDPCRDQGDYACTSDRIAALRCVANKMVLINTCRGPKSCSIVHPAAKTTDIDCDMSVAVQNDPCVFPNNEACMVGGKGMLTCLGGKYASPRGCPGPNGCAVTTNGKSFKVTCDTRTQ